MITVLTKNSNKAFGEDCDHGCSPHKDSNIGHFCEYCDHNHSSNKEDCDHSRNPIKTQKHDIFVRTAIMVAILINSAFCEDCVIEVLRNRAAIIL